MDLPLAPPPLVPPQPQTAYQTNLLTYQSGLQPRGWIVVDASDSFLELRDPDITLIQATLQAWWMPLLSGIVFVMVALIELTRPPLPLRFVQILSFACGWLMLWCIWVRWRTPSVVRIGGGRFSIASRRGRKTSNVEFDVHEIVYMETAHGSPTFHSHFSFRVHLRDGSRHIFLHCKNGLEANWLLRLMADAVAKEAAAQFLIDAPPGLVPASAQPTLPPPPLPDVMVNPALNESLGRRVAAIEEQVVAPLPTEQKT